ncbi:MAG: flagellar brake domain-containing protein [Phycisphaerales bacterium JB065]
MPATRSRTENWHRSLVQIYERGGALEITLPRYLGKTESGVPTVVDTDSDQVAKNIIWRVRILDMDKDSIVVDQPMVLGQTFDLKDGIEIVGIIAIGQNRWMFRTKVLQKVKVELGGGRASATCLKLQMPTQVERCQRRNFYRVSTVGLDLPQVTMFPLLDIQTAIIAETACREEIFSMEDKGLAGKIGPEDPASLRLPEVGPSREARLMNIGGGGVGLILDSAQNSGMDTHQAFWIRIDLRPDIPAPLCAVARLRHTHIDSSQRLYAGLAFEFSHNPSYQKFLVDQLCKYVAKLQRQQMRID